MDIPQFLLAVTILELTPGPNMAYLATLTLQRGRVAGLIATAGVAAGLSVHAVVAGLGAGALIAASPLLYETLRWLGVAYLLYLAWEGWRSAPEPSPERVPDFGEGGRLFMRGFLSNVFNPKSVLFFVTVLPRFLGSGSGDPPLPVQMAIFGILYVGVATLVHVVIVTMAGRLQPYLVSGRRRDLTRRILSAALACVAVWLAFSTAR
jgi:threonine/homoserine/homoserine lactone efflux protein